MAQMAAENWLTAHTKHEVLYAQPGQHNNEQQDVDTHRWHDFKN